MRYFVVEDEIDVSAYGSIESAATSIEAVDIPRMRLFDEYGNEYFLKIGTKEVIFFGVKLFEIPATQVGTVTTASMLEFEKILQNYASQVMSISSDTHLPILVDLIVNFQRVPP